MTAPQTCDRCPALVACRKHVINGDGRGNTIMFVGEYPDAFSDNNDYAFYGRQGKLLASIVDAAGIQRQDTYRSYAVRCTTPGKPKRKPSKAEMVACHDYLIQEIEQVKPAVIVALGPTAAQSLLGVADRSSYEQALDVWNNDIEMAQHEYDAALARWAMMTPKQRKDTGTRKPNKPKAAAKPKPPTDKQISVNALAGYIQEQPETGIPVVVSYGLNFILSGKWEYIELMVRHFQRAVAVANDTEPWEYGGTPRNYPVISTPEQMEALERYLLAHEGDTIWFDCETGVNHGTKWMEAELLCFSFSVEHGEAFVVPWLWHIDQAPYYQAFWAPDVFKRIIAAFRRIFASKKRKGGHNVLFDIRMLERTAEAYMDAVTALGIKVEGDIADTELLSHAIEEGVPHNMTNLLSYHTHWPFYEDEIKKFKPAMHKAPNEIIWPYSGADADVLPLLWDTMRPVAEKEGTNWVLDNITSKMLRVCREIENNGMLVDVAHFDALCKFYEDQIEEYEQTLWQATSHRPEGWKYNDAKTLRQVLFQELGLPTSGRKTKAGRGCQDCTDGVCFEHDQTGKDALEDIIKAGYNHPALPAIIRLKNLTKRRSTYLDGGNGGFKKHIRRDNRIHGTMKVSRTETGRLASEEPNIQNIPNYIHIHPKGATCDDNTCKAFYDETYGLDTQNAFHDAFIAAPGKAFMNIDWSQLEIWVLAYTLYEWFGDKTLLNVLLSGTDIHIWMARQMYPTVDPEMSDSDWKKAHPDLRRRAKVANFGIGYGLTAQGFVNREGCTLEEAEDTIARYKSIVPIELYFNKIREDVEFNQFVANWAGRRRHINFLHVLKAMGLRAEVEAVVRECINFPIQSGGSDLHSLASYRTLEYIESGPLSGRGCKIIGSVHDSLMLEVDAPDPQYVEETARIIKNLWADIALNTIRPNGKPLGWEVPCEVEWGQRWGTSEFVLEANGHLKDLRVVLVEKEEVDPDPEPVVVTWLEDKFTGDADAID